MLIKMSRPTCWLLLPVLLALAGSAAAAQFAATMLIKDAGKVVPGRIFVQDGKMRQEFNDEAGQTVTIVRPDQKVVWVIIPRERTYLEMPLKKKLPGQFIQIPQEATKRLLGKETVNGYEAEKYQVMVKEPRGVPEIQFIWVAPKLGTPVKLTSKGGSFAVEYQDIKEGPQPDRLFTLPPGFKKLASPDLPPSLKGY